MVKPIKQIQRMVHQNNGSFFPRNYTSQTATTFRNKSYYIHDNNKSWTPKPVFTNFVQSITAKLPGFKIRFNRAIEPMKSAKTVGDMQRFFQAMPHIRRRHAAPALHLICRSGRNSFAIAAPSNDLPRVNFHIHRDYRAPENQAAPEIAQNRICTS